MSLNFPSSPAPVNGDEYFYAPTNTTYIFQDGIWLVKSIGIENPNHLHEETGYDVLPSGLILQWGVTAAVAAGGSIDVIVPKPWSVGAYVVIANRVQASPGVTAYAFWGMPKSLTEVTLFNGTQTGSTPIQWHAVGK